MYYNSESHQLYRLYTKRSDEESSSRATYSPSASPRGILRSRSHSSTSTYRSHDWPSPRKRSSGSVGSSRGSSLADLQRSLSTPFLSCFKGQRSETPEKKQIRFTKYTKKHNGKPNEGKTSNSINQQDEDNSIELNEFNQKSPTKRKLKKKIPIKEATCIQRAEIDYYCGSKLINTELVFDPSNCKITEIIKESHDKFLKDSVESPLFDDRTYVFIDTKYDNDQQNDEDAPVDFKVSVHSPDSSPPTNSVIRIVRSMMAPITNKEKKIILEFCHLLEKSKQLFNGLRSLAPYGNKQWQDHFGRTFDTYTKLWKFQQTNRSVLDAKYGLKRWQIGEIASKIGQLYYHFYLRTSDISYLIEAFSFYQAIRGRRYYDLANQATKCELMVKKLRYYARFIVVAILLRQTEILDELVRELESQVFEYGHAYQKKDCDDWFRVLEEVKTFIIADPGVVVIDVVNNNRAVTLSGRLNNYSIPYIERTKHMNLRLQEAVVIGSGTQLAKFSELTIDMFRILQNLEWDVEGSISDRFIDSPHASGKSSEPSKRINVRCTGGNVNPHKYLLYMPSPSQAIAYLGSAVHELPKKSALLIYISAEGFHPYQSHTDKYDYELGGVITSFKYDTNKANNRDVKPGSSKYRNKNVLYPGDLEPFSRNPLVLIVDSDNSYAFQHITGTFGAPVLVLMSPMTAINNRSTHGSLFTLFLHNPIAGLCNICGVYDISLEKWEQCIRLRDVFMKETIRLLMISRINSTFYAFLGCEILRLLIVRFVFCCTALRTHKDFNSIPDFPRCTPPLPEYLIINTDLVGIILEIADILDVRDYFVDIRSPGGRPMD